MGSSRPGTVSLAARSVINAVAPRWAEALSAGILAAACICCPVFAADTPNPPKEGTKASDSAVNDNPLLAEIQRIRPEQRCLSF